MDSVDRSSEPKYECLLFDMDDTLYSLSSGLNLACRKNIEEYMLQNLGINENEVPKMCLDLYKEYGTTMAGLKALGYEFDNDEFHQYIHGRLPYEKLKPDPFLRSLLLSMPQRKIIFTNADKAHVANVLARLGLEDCFEGVICFETLNPPVEFTEENSYGFEFLTSDIQVEPKRLSSLVDENFDICESSKISLPKLPILCKPSVEAFEAAIQIANVNPKKTIFFDDSARNIAAAKTAGLHTVLVGGLVVVQGADVALTSIHNMREALPEIWLSEEEKEEEQAELLYPATPIETFVLA
ncbi:uncharacterized protein C24B11.05 [Amborella trichopoda]|uniref:Uncharacterized protein n=1 Tax=Amborella trichopoda TaxID=13333 RepID=W1P6C7_AMBTC|nr:uncharacterized protein C24B11.05 [Amborella trichopoda]XP_011622237.1 uncharacterized protein C24B11.05 [Amborella trichopoda]ERN03199.1 hypothetical protein AMTR_s00003p00149130 [Amborella trichopoda]|eukprot:XP_006841524.1 uncharacterized protein C24B11.05 [Amborella trichopoda]